MNETRLLMRSRFVYTVNRKVGDGFEKKCFYGDTDLYSRFPYSVYRRNK